MHDIGTSLCDFLTGMMFYTIVCIDTSWGSASWQVIPYVQVMLIGNHALLFLVHMLLCMMSLLAGCRRTLCMVMMCCSHAVISAVACHQ